MFERDKAELRELGIPLETGRTSIFDIEEGYRIARRDYELPDGVAGAGRGRRGRPGRPAVAVRRAGRRRPRRAAQAARRRGGRRAGPHPGRRAPAGRGRGGAAPCLDAVQAGRAVRFAYRKPYGETSDRGRSSPGAWCPGAAGGIWSATTGTGARRAASGCPGCSARSSPVGPEGAVKVPTGSRPGRATWWPPSRRSTPAWPGSGCGAGRAPGCARSRPGSSPGERGVGLGRRRDRVRRPGVDRRPGRPAGRRRGRGRAGRGPGGGGPRGCARTPAPGRPAAAGDGSTGRRRRPGPATGRRRSRRDGGERLGGPAAAAAGPAAVPAGPPRRPGRRGGRRLRRARGPAAPRPAAAVDVRAARARPRRPDRPVLRGRHGQRRARRRPGPPAAADHRRGAGAGGRAAHAGRPAAADRPGGGRAGAGQGRAAAGGAVEAASAVARRGRADRPGAGPAAGRWTRAARCT